MNDYQLDKPKYTAAEVAEMWVSPPLTVERGKDLKKRGTMGILSCISRTKGATHGSFYCILP